MTNSDELTRIFVFLGALVPIDGPIDVCINRDVKLFKHTAWQKIVPNHYPEDVTIVELDEGEGVQYPWCVGWFREV